MTGKTHVVVPTTQGPVFIQALTREEPDVPSVVCLSGGSESAGISTAYYDFVKKGSGLIARETGHPAWRLDIESDISEGKSWQLAVFLAHILEQRNQLGSGKPEPGDTVVWATGQVRFDRAVGSIRHLERKLDSSRRLIERLGRRGVNVVAVAPQPDVEAVMATPSASAASELNLQGVARVDEAILQLGAATSKRDAGQESPVSRPSRATSRAGAALVIVAALVGVLITLNLGGLDASDTPGEVGTSAPDAIDAPPPTPARNVEARVAPELLIGVVEDGEDCDDASLTLVPLVPSDDGERPGFEPVAMTGICTMQVVASENDLADVLFLPIDVDRPRPLALMGDNSRGFIPVPKYQGLDRRYVLIVTPERVPETALASFTRLLKLYRQRLSQDGEIEGLIERAGFEGTVYEHTLLAADSEA